MLVHLCHIIIDINNIIAFVSWARDTEIRASCLRAYYYKCQVYVDKGNRNDSAMEVECLHSWQPAAHVHYRSLIILQYLQRLVLVVPASVYLCVCLVYVCVCACTYMAHTYNRGSKLVFNCTVVLCGPTSSRLKDLLV